jgi:hypothetical protein
VPVRDAEERWDRSRGRHRLGRAHTRAVLTVTSS